MVLKVAEGEAPEELTFLRELTPLDDGAALRRIRGRRRRTEPIGFGQTGMTALTSGVVWFVLDQFASEFVTRAGGDAESGLRRLLGRLLRRRREPARIPPLSAEQLKLVRTRIYDAMVASRISTGRSAAVADRVIQELATHTPEVEGRGSE
ncbi:hypothetical protein [Streptacidiphilus sp. P02-A3a]|uniref:hypothetical protein n=1 Tax=Streptacidiphilus sp. P02-A3a TaxID=2704468 RepID=UPI0015FD4965|nr:hypothetical protein [Streptacidiphilus sp. P02-A3a]QMU72565.1 hypothetical protein GXP74_34275 [Streptacidiphilus sp. P02-A3a]